MMGVYHPDAPDFFKDIKAYRDWQKKRYSQSRKGAKKGDSSLATLRPGERSDSTVAMLFFRKHLMQDRSYINDTICAFENAGVDVLPIFVTGIEGHVVVRDWLAKEKIDVLVSMIGFALVGGPAGSTKPGVAQGSGAGYLAASECALHRLAAAVCAGCGFVEGARCRADAGVATYSLPEMDGAITPVILGAIQDGHFKSMPDRLNRLVHAWQRNRQHCATSRTKTRSSRFVVYDYPPGLGKKATAALLDVPRSLFNILTHLQA